MPGLVEGDAKCGTSEVDRFHTKRRLTSPNIERTGPNRDSGRARAPTTFFVFHFLVTRWIHKS